MKKNRSELRNVIMNILYQVDIYESKNIEYNIDDVIKDNIKEESDFVNDIVKGTIINKGKIDNTLNSLIKDWSIDRIDKVGASILRMGIYELEYMDTPKAVVINECVNLASKYSNLNVKNIVNAVLDKYEK